MSEEFQTPDGPDEHEKKARELTAQPYVPPSVAATHQYGVLYQGEFETPSDGTATAVRLHAQALAATGVPLILRSFSGVVINEYNVAEPVFVAGMPDEVRKQVGHLLDTSIGEVKPVIKHVVIRDAPHLQKLLIPRSATIFENVAHQLAMRDAIYENTIVYSVWERSRIDPAIARQLARVKQCWVPCRQNRNMLITSGVPAERVHVVPHPYTDDDLIHSCLKRKSRQDNAKRFYSIGRWEPRKGMAELIHAFVTTFTPDEPHTLTIKYTGGHWPGYPTPESVREACTFSGDRGWTREAFDSRINLIDGRLKRSKIVQLHYENNIYVSASHGEAWNLPAFEAKLAGNHLVHVAYGGTEDFCEPHDTRVPWALGPVDKSYRWESDAEWASYHIEELAFALQRAEPPEGFRRPPDFEERFSMSAVGRQMRELVERAVPGLFLG